MKLKDKKNRNTKSPMFPFKLFQAATLAKRGLRNLNIVDILRSTQSFKKLNHFRNYYLPVPTLKPLINVTAKMRYFFNYVKNRPQGQTRFLKPTFTKEKLTKLNQLAKKDKIYV